MKTGRRDFLKSIVLATAGLMIGHHKPQETKAERHHYGLYVDENGNETRYIDGKLYEGEAASFPFGCGAGGLFWEEVEPIVEQYSSGGDNWLIVCDLPQAHC